MNKTQADKILGLEAIAARAQTFCEVNLKRKYDADDVVLIARAMMVGANLVLTAMTEETNKENICEEFGNAIPDVEGDALGGGPCQ